MRGYLRSVWKKLATPETAIFLAFTVVVSLAVGTVYPVAGATLAFLLVIAGVVLRVGLRRFPKTVVTAVATLRGDTSLGPAMLKQLRKKQSTGPPPAGSRLDTAGAGEAILAIVRVLGNDLEPRHAAGQTLRNLRFILEHEEDFPGVYKHWIVNRITDPEVEGQITELLDASGHHYTRIPFSSSDYQQVGWDMGALPTPSYLLSDDVDELGIEQRRRLLLGLYRNKNRYLMNNNGARNLALDEGRRQAHWVAAWDGNCFVTTSAWEAIREDLHSFPHIPIRVVPMERLGDSEPMVNHSAPSAPYEEPQLIFRHDCDEQFNEDFVYGARPKIEMFWRLGLPGPWAWWPDEPWDPARRPPLEPALPYRVAGWVGRLGSGKPQFEHSTAESFSARGRQREVAIMATLTKAATATKDTATGLPPGLYDPDRLAALFPSTSRAPVSAVLAEVGHQLAARADAIMAASAPEDSSTALLDTTALALMFQATGDETYANRALEIASQWAEGTTARSMISRRRGAAKAGGLPRLPGFAAACDALGVLRVAGVGSDETWRPFTSWVKGYLNWFRTDPVAARIRTSGGSDGAWYDLHRASAELFLGEREAFELSVFRGLTRFSLPAQAGGLWENNGELAGDAGRVTSTLLPRCLLFAVAARHGLSLGPVTSWPVSEVVRALGQMSAVVAGSISEDSPVFPEFAVTTRLAAVAGLIDGHEAVDGISTDALPFAGLV